MNNQLDFVLFSLVMCVFSIPSTAYPDDSSSTPTLLEFQSQLQDHKQNPIAGVLPLEFDLYESPKGDEPLWTTQRFVAVEDGNYRVTFGEKTDLPRAVVNSAKWVRVRLQGEGEILRAKLTSNRRQSSQAKSSPSRKSSNTQANRPLDVDEKTKQLLKDAEDKKEITFANIADRAVKADHAKVADKANRIGDLTAEQIENKLENTLDKLGKHAADSEAHGATGGVSLGEGERIMEQTGGSGGNPYKIDCPPNHVVTGIKGGSGRLVDSITVVCTPLK